MKGRKAMQDIRRIGMIACLGMALGALAGFPRRAIADEQNPVVQNTPAPELTGKNWINTPGSAPVHLASRRGKVTIVHFWTYGCINCRHNLPAYARWQKELTGKEVVIIGVHTPETRGEASDARVRAHVKSSGITYPVLVDSDSANWNRWNQHFWPTVYLIDKKCRIRYRWEGELEYDNQHGATKMLQRVNDLLNEK
jgi:thiol-disulfide isomerase/thioredoxin